VKLAMPRRPSDPPPQIPPALWSLLWAGLLLQIVWLVFLIAVSAYVLVRHLWLG